jgi:hypothetical protein
MPWMRVVQRTVKQISEEEYLVTLTLTGKPSPGNNLLAIRCTDLGGASYFDLALDATVSGSPVRLIDYGATWKYLEGAAGHTSGFEASAFDDAAWASGAAQFGTDHPACPGYASVTAWALNTDLLVRKYVTVPADATALSLIFGIDNDATIYWNGALIHTVSAAGCAAPGSNIRWIDSWL